MPDIGRDQLIGSATLPTDMVASWHNMFMIIMTTALNDSSSFRCQVVAILFMKLSSNTMNSEIEHDLLVPPGIHSYG